jgi:hypothetical protein
MTQTQRRKQRWKKWRKLISQQARSGQNVAAFCRERELCAPHFFAWRKRIEQAEAQKFVEVQVASMAPPPATAGAAIEVRLKNGLRLLVPNGFEGPHLQALLAILETGA